MHQYPNNQWIVDGDLAEMLSISPKLMYKLSNQTTQFYRIFKVPKKSGGFRTIDAPAPILKLVLQRILRAVLAGRRPSPIATAFRHNHSIKDNARPHVGQKVILKLDIKDFFPSLKSPAVFSLFKELGFSENVTVLLTKLCTLYGHLPQGAPTSPCLSNLLMKPVDNEIVTRFADRDINITRYADDFTFSGDLSDDDIREIIHACRTAIAGLGLKLNSRKIHVLRAGNRQAVTGLVVNQVVRAPREMRRQLRQTMYYLNKFGEHDWEKLDEPTLNHLLGIANFIWDADRANPEFDGYRQQLLEIKSSGISY